jgi:hypothetical protein
MVIFIEDLQGRTTNKLSKKNVAATLHHAEICSVRRSARLRRLGVLLKNGPKSDRDATNKLRFLEKFIAKLL